VSFGLKIKLYNTGTYIIILYSNYDILNIANKKGFIKLSLTKQVFKDFIPRLHCIYYFNLK